MLIIIPNWRKEKRSRHKLAENIHNTYIWQTAEYPQLTDKKTSTNKRELMIKTQTSQRRYTKGQEEHVSFEYL